MAGGRWARRPGGGGGGPGGSSRTAARRRSRHAISAAPAGGSEKSVEKRPRKHVHSLDDPSNLTKPKRKTKKNNQSIRKSEKNGGAARARERKTSENNVLRENCTDTHTHTHTHTHSSLWDVDSFRTLSRLP